MFGAETINVYPWRYSNLIDMIAVVLVLFLCILIQNVSSCNVSLECQKIIKCENHSLTAIAIDCLQKSEIKKLYFDYNSIKEVTSIQLDDLQNLEVLSLKGNNLEYVDYTMFSSKPKLWSINLNENNLSYINSSSFGELPKLTKLQLDANQISTIRSGSFDKLSMLDSLYLSRNKINIIEESAFSDKCTVNFLYLDNNLLQNVTFLKNFNSLKFLNLSFNKLQIIPKETFANLINLTTLYCNNNALEELEFLQFLRSLQKLNLSNNAITKIRIDVFNELVNLQQLDLAHNKITHIGSGTFFGINKLSLIDLSFNNIKNMGEILENLAIKEIHLNHNQLTNISIPNTAVNRALYIDGNQWNCQFIKHVLDGNKARLIYTNMTNTTNVRGVACIDGFERQLITRENNPTTEIPLENASIAPGIQFSATETASLHILVITIICTALTVTLIFTIVKIVNCRKRPNQIYHGNCGSDINEEDYTATNKVTDPNKPPEDCDGYLVPTQLEHIYDEIKDHRLNDYV